MSGRDVEEIEAGMSRAQFAAHDEAAGNPFRALSRATEAGFCVVAMTFENGQGVDYRFLETNAVFTEQTGLVDPVGRCASELVPDLEPFWARVYGEVAMTGKTARFENGSEPMGRWFDVTAFALDERRPSRVGILFNDISARRPDEMEQRATEERLQLALSAGQGIGTWDWDVPADRVKADSRFAALYGVDPNVAAAGAPLSEFFGGIHRDDLPRIRESIANAMTTGETFSEEYRLAQADGSIVWVAAEGRCRLDAEGKPLRFPGVSFDITRRKRFEARQSALLEFSERTREASSPAEIAYIGSEVLGHALDVSRVGYGIIDKAAETITIERDWNAPGIQTIAGVLHFREHGSYIDDLKRGETVTVADARLDPRTRDNAPVLEAISARAFINMPLVEQGQSVALIYANHAGPRVWAPDDILLMRDIAERVRASAERWRVEAALRESEEQFRVFAEAVPNQIWAARGDGCRDWFNDRVRAYTGLASSSLDGHDAWKSIIHPDDRASAEQAWARALATGEIYETEFRMRRHDGRYRWFLVRAEPVLAVDGTPTRWVGTNTDIDDQRRQSAELERLNETLEEEVAARTQRLMVAEEALRQSQKMEAVGQLTGGIAHDFNNLLTGIIGSLELLTTRIAQGRLGDVERYTTAAQGAARRAAALTHRLLAFSRRQTLDPKPTSMNALIGGMEELVRRTVGPAVEVEVVLAAGLWTTLVDPNQLENSLLNLCINARDAMPEGGRLTIETANRWLDTHAARDRDLAPGQYISLCVSDTGTGMAPDIVSKAFDPFFTTKPLGMGTGLGLSMVYGFTRQSGGQVRIYSEPGHGAMVCIYLPRHLGEAEDSPAAPDLVDAPRARAGETVLVVDDEPTVRMIVMEVLEGLGYAAIEAADGNGGMRILESDARIDLLVTDVGLPGGMNGRQLADAARVSRKDLKILFITGYAENAVIGNGPLEPGMHVLTKPFAMETLASRIKDLIEAD